MTGRTAVLALAAAAAASGLLARPAVSQEAAGASDTLRLSLDEATAIALRHNPGLRQAANDLTLEGFERRELWMNQLLPSPSLTLFETGYSGYLTRQATDFFGNPIENPTTDWAYSSSTQQRLGLTWRIQGPSLVNALRAQKAVSETRGVEVDAVRWELRTEVRRRFFDALEQRELLEVERALAEARSDDAELAMRLFELAENTRVDVLNAELEIERQAMRVESQRRDHHQALLALRTTLGDPDAPPIAVEQEPLSIFDPAGLDESALAERAMDRGPQVERARAALREAEIAGRESRQQWWPTLNVSASVSRLAQTREEEALFDVSFDEDLQSRFSLSLSFPFFDDYFGNRLAIARSEVQADDARERLREARLTTRERVGSAMADLRSRWESLTLADRALAIAEEALELAREEYRMGTRTFEQLQQAIRQESDARREVTTARYGFVDALLGLEEAVGGPVEPPAAGSGDDRHRADGAPASPPTPPPAR